MLLLKNLSQTPTLHKMKSKFNNMVLKASSMGPCCVCSLYFPLQVKTHLLLRTSQSSCLHATFPPQNLAVLYLVPIHLSYIHSVYHLMKTYCIRCLTGLQGKRKVTKIESLSLNNSQFRVEHGRANKYIK